MEFVDGDERVRRVSLMRVRRDAVRVRSGAAVVPVVSRAAQLARLWWSATTGGYIGYESWLERGHAMLLDIEEVTAFAATERACGLLGWGYRRVGAVEPVLAENVR